jgi:hypothetical protein
MADIDDLKAAFDQFVTALNARNLNGSLIFPVEDSIYSGISPPLVQTRDSLPDPEKDAERDGPS